MSKLNQPTLESWDQSFKQQLERAARVTAELTPEELVARPAPEKWGVDHCLEHLAVTLGVYRPYLTGAIEKAEGKSAAGTPDYRPGRFARWFFGFLKPDGKPVPAPKKFRPSAGLSPGAEGRFRGELKEYRALLARADRVNVNGTKFRSPVSPLLRFSIGEGFHLMVLHQDRHLGQAERARAVVREERAAE